MFGYWGREFERIIFFSIFMVLKFLVKCFKYIKLKSDYGNLEKKLRIRKLSRNSLAVNQC